MLILRKNKIIITLSCVIIAIVGIETIFNMAKEKNTIETVALPVNNKVIVIDAGHGGEDGGATTEDRYFRSKY